MSTPISGGISGGAHARHRLLPCAIALALVVTLVWGDAARPAAVLGERGPASVVDHDGDGVCDGEDILAAARAYVATNPRYEGAYVQGGRPRDGSGVCTDLVDQALLGAGYDLRALIDADAREHPEAYPAIEVCDPDIDFRRVANQAAWLSRHACPCTLDPYDVGGWQAGDVVCWEDHIGIVSDRRDPHGVALVLHHASPWQASFEEDALLQVALGRICGHWRMGVGDVLAGSGA